MATATNVQQAEDDRTERTRDGQVYQPRVDIFEHQDELLLLADMPGVKSNTIDIRFEDGMLTIRGTVEPRCKQDTHLLLCEYGVGDFQRTFRVGEQIDSGAIHAEYRDGVLTVHLPKAQAAKPRKIQIKTA